jgi:hypothetical protein
MPDYNAARIDNPGLASGLGDCVLSLNELDTRRSPGYHLGREGHGDERQAGTYLVPRV